MVSAMLVKLYTAFYCQDEGREKRAEQKLAVGSPFVQPVTNGKKIAHQPTLCTVAHVKSSTRTYFVIQVGPEAMLRSLLKLVCPSSSLLPRNT